MRLSELMKQYRETHGLSMREFAEMSGLSKGYISMLEKNINPTTDDAIVPTLPTLQKLANAMDMSLDELLHEVAPDTMVRVHDGSRSEIDRLMDELPADKQADIMKYAKYVASSYKNETDADRANQQDIANDAREEDLRNQ